MPDHSIHWNVERHPVVDSTNRIAVDRIHTAWAHAHDPAGQVIVAERQHAGRGQHGRVWESPPGGLYLSAIVTRIPPDLRGLLALIAGLAAAEALGLDDLPVRLRWPNDLILAGKKCGGILCESVAQSDRWAGVVGIGINVNTNLNELPRNLRPRATCLALAHERHHPLQAIETAILHALADTLSLACAAGIESIVSRVRPLDDLLGKNLEFHDGESTIHGRAAGIGDAGELLIHTEHRIRAFPTGTLIAINGERLRPRSNDR